MDCPIVFFLECNINPDAFLTAWNDAAACRDTVLAQRRDQPR
jgi:hypothetical protein